MLILSMAFFVAAWWWALRKLPWRERLVALYLLVGLWLALITELCSWGHQLKPWTLACGWSAGALAGLLASQRPGAHNISRATENKFIWPDRDLVWLAMGSAAVLLITFLSGLLVPPNNWDSLTYHLPRVMHWQQNGHVHPYPTATILQLWGAPFAEYAILHLQLFLGSDRAAFLVQWLALLGVSIVVSLIAARLGASARGQMLSAFCALMLPEAILQGSSTQNDLVVALYMCTFVFYFYDWQRQPSWWSLAGAGVALALALFSKGTTLFFCAAFGFWVALAVMRRWRGRALPALLLMGLFILLLNGPFMWRTHSVTQQWFPGSPELRNGILGFCPLLSNLLRNAALHLVWPWNGRCCVLENHLIERVHQWLGCDLNDPHTTWPGTNFWANFSTPHEDTAANVAHSVLLLGVACYVLVFGWRRERRKWLLHGLCLLAGLVLFCGLLKWQPWHTRLHTGWFLLAMPLLGVVLERLRRPWLMTVCGLLFLSAVHVALWNQSRAWVGERSLFNTSRAEQFYFNRPVMLRRFLEATQWLQAHNVQALGIRITAHEWEYPIWRELRRRHSTAPTIQHVLVDNPSAALEQRELRWADFHPDFILDMHDSHEETVSYHGDRYQLAQAGKGFKIFALAPPLPP